MESKFSRYNWHYKWHDYGLLVTVDYIMAMWKDSTWVQFNMDIFDQNKSTAKTDRDWSDHDLFWSVWVFTDLSLLQTVLDRGGSCSGFSKRFLINSSTEKSSTTNNWQTNDEQ